jgi:hypothetical protein
MEIRQAVGWDEMMIDPSNPYLFIGVVVAVYTFFCIIFWERMKGVLYAIQDLFS